jgi:hypothetical protein
LAGDSSVKRTTSPKHTWYGRSTTIIGAANRKIFKKGKVQQTVSRISSICLIVAYLIGWSGAEMETNVSKTAVKFKYKKDPLPQCKINSEH